VRDLLGTVMERFSLSASAYHPILRIARTIADMDGAGWIETQHVAEAIQYQALACA